MRENQAIGACIVCGIVAAVAAVMLLVSRCSVANEPDPALWGMDQYWADSLAEVQAMHKDSMWAARQAEWAAEKEARRLAREAEWAARQTAWQANEVPLRLQSFDPNSADSLTLLEVGLKPWQVRAMLRYRAVGGVYRKPEDMRRMYGMTDSMYAALEPWIAIAPLPADTATPVAQPMAHQKKDTLIELNSADTASLQYLRGIGSVTAMRIVAYRERLGGYVSVAQLAEIGVSDSVQNRLTVVPHVSRTIRVNSQSAAAMAKHPYMNYTQATAIEDLRHRRTIRSLDQIEKLGCFSAEEWDKLKPYLSLE